MSIGMKRGTVFLEPHLTEWEIAAKEAIRTIKSILGDIAADIQHIGSTSIKAIKAKPIIDIAVAVNDFEAVLQKRAELEKRMLFPALTKDRSSFCMLWAILKMTLARIISMLCFTVLMSGITTSTFVII